MSLIDAFRRLNKLKRGKVLRDYAVFGAIAFSLHVEPVTTEYVDIIIDVDSDEEYLSQLNRVAAETGGFEGMHVIVEDFPVKMFPSTIKPIYRASLENARPLRIDTVSVKVVTPPYLVLLLLESFRVRDKVRITALFEEGRVNVRQIEELLEDFEGELEERFDLLRRQTGLA